MGLLGKLLKEGSEAAAAALAQVVVTGADILDNAEKKRNDLARKFDEKATKVTGDVVRTRDNLAQAVEDHLSAFADAFENTLEEIAKERRAADAPAPQSTVTEATPETVAKTKQGLKTPAATPQPAATEAPAKPKQPRKRAARTPKKPSL
jgi:hypothetical protein